MTITYSGDFYAWVMEQAHFLKTGQFSQLDLAHLIEEIEDMGKSEKRTLESRLEVLLMHLLKWAFQPERQGNSWRLTIEDQRERLLEHLEENPSLRAKLDESVIKAYRHAVRGAVQETGLPRTHFPETCPYPLADILDEQFYPDLKGEKNGNDSN